MPLVREGSEGDMMRILIVEDDRELAAALDDALRYEGYATSLATTGVEALKILAGTNVDIMLLDRDLPVLSGDAVMATVAANRIPVAVIMLTAAAEVSDRVSGLDLGADDYLTKPFAYPELLARIRALQRRSGTSNATAAVLTRGDITLDSTRRLVFRDHGRTLVKLTPKEYGILLELMRAEGGYVTAHELYDAVWDEPTAADPTDVIKTTIYSLRRKLADREAIVSTRGKDTGCNEGDEHGESIRSYTGACRQTAAQIIPRQTDVGHQSRVPHRHGIGDPRADHCGQQHVHVRHDGHRQKP